MSKLYKYYYSFGKVVSNGLLEYQELVKPRVRLCRRRQQIDENTRQNIVIFSSCIGDDQNKVKRPL